MRRTLEQVSVFLTLWAYRTAASFEIPSSFPRTSSLYQLHMTMNTPEGFKVLGICGGIGSGKSTAAKLLVSDCDCLVHLDADSLAHSVYSPGSQAVKEIAAEFGSEVLVQQQDILEIDRKKLGAIVFSDRKDMAVSICSRSRSSSMEGSAIQCFFTDDLTVTNKIGRNSNAWFGHMSRPS